MPVLQSCWSPCWCYSNVKHGTVAVGVFTIIASVVTILYAIWVLDGGHSSELYSPLFESDIRNTTKIAAGLIITYCLLFIIFSILMVYGIRKDFRGFLLPFLVWMGILVLYTTALGIWFIARYYTYPISVLSAIFTWLFTCVAIYCWLCVFSHYQVLKDYQSGNVVILYP